MFDDPVVKAEYEAWLDEVESQYPDQEPEEDQ